MPTVPRIAERQIATSPIQGGQLSQPPAGAFDGLNQTMGATEKLAVDIFTEEKKKADQIAVLDADSQISALKTRIDIGLENYKGKDAAGSIDYARKEWDNGFAEIEKGLTNDDQRMAVKGRGIGHWADLDSKVQKHTATELKDYERKTIDAWTVNTRDWAASNYKEPGLIQGTLDAMNAVINDFAKRNGYSPDDEVVKALKQDNAKKLHTAIIDRMLANGEDIAATDHFNIYKDAFGVDTAAMETKLGTASTDGEAARIAPQIFAEMGPKRDIDPVNIAQMTAFVREKYADKPKLLKAINTEIRQMGADWNAQQQEREQGNKAAVWRAVEQGASLKTIRSMPEYQALPGDDEVIIKNHIVDRAEVLANRKKEQTTDGQQAKYWEYSKPDNLANMTENQILNLVPDIGWSLVNKLMAEKRSMENVDLSEVKLDDKTFKEIAQSAGLNPFKPSMTEAEKADLSKLLDQTKTILAAEQTAKGRRLTMEEKKAIMQREIDNKVLVDVNWSFDEKERTVMSLSEEEAARIIVPFEERTRLEDSFRGVGKLVTEDKIRRLYLAKKKNNMAEAVAILGER